MSISPGGQVVFSAIGLFAVVSILLFVRHTLRHPNLVKAKLFLNYERFSRYSLAVLLLVLAGVAANMALTLGGGYVDASFESWGAFARNKALTLSVFAGLGAGCLGLLKMLR